MCPGHVPIPCGWKSTRGVLGTGPTPEPTRVRRIRTSDLVHIGLTTRVPRQSLRPSRSDLFLQPGWYPLLPHPGDWGSLGECTETPSSRRLQGSPVLRPVSIGPRSRQTPGVSERVAPVPVPPLPHLTSASVSGSRPPAAARVVGVEVLGRVTARESPSVRPLAGTGNFTVGPRSGGTAHWGPCGTDRDPRRRSEKVPPHLTPRLVSEGLPGAGPGSRDTRGRPNRTTGTEIRTPPVPGVDTESPEWGQDPRPVLPWLDTDLASQGVCGGGCESDTPDSPHSPTQSHGLTRGGGPRSQRD